ncbi:MAG TPA: pyridoxal phosphate-dependent aminotransferase [Gaiellaceae bacterium]|nr:pyridoxal phosphate-dependent aminotransferase [Gaiellaceae bacterium]
MASAPLAQSPTLAANEAIARRLAAGRPVVHLAFGEAGLPVHPALAERLAAAAPVNGYGPVAGDPELRAAVAGYFERRRLPTDPELVVPAPGSKALLFALLTLLPGDVVLPVPSWVSYAAQATLAGKRVVPVEAPAEAGGVPDPDALDAALVEARQAGLDPRVLVLTLPDNPTGTIAGESLLQRVCAVAEREGVTIVSDEIYRDLAFDDPRGVVSPAELHPDGTIVTTGLSKSLALGGWRIGVARLPGTPAGERLRSDLLGFASEVWSALARPMQAVAAFAFAEPPELAEHLDASRRLHATTTRALHRVFVDGGATCRPPAGAFYLYPDLEPLREPLAAHGATSSASLGEVLLDDFDVAVLPGHHFGDDPSALRFRAAASLLYGATAEQRWESLSAGDPLGLPWIAAALEQVRGALAHLRG